MSPLKNKKESLNIIEEIEEEKDSDFKNLIDITKEEGFILLEMDEKIKILVKNLKLNL
jgi:hypothetical protein